jgi:hypothetical protein
MLEFNVQPVHHLSRIQVMPTSSETDVSFQPSIIQRLLGSHETVEEMFAVGDEMVLSEW